MINENTIFDTIIIGSGPAGYTAAIYASRRGMKTLLIGKEPGGQIVWASEIENYPGFLSISNFELIEKLQSHVKSLNVDIIDQEMIKIEKNDIGYEIITHDERFLSKTVIICTGLSPKRLEIPGENEFIGKGVSYCATCDAPFYRNKIVAVVGGGNSALDAAENLSKIAEKVYLIYRGNKFRAFETLVDTVIARTNIEIIFDTNVEKILGVNKVEKIFVVNNQNHESKEIDINGIFIEAGHVASTDMFKEMLKLDDKNQIIIDEKCKSSTEGIFAAGDVTNVPYKQIIIACGQGAIAALSAYEYLQLKKNK